MTPISPTPLRRTALRLLGAGGAAAAALVTALAPVLPAEAEQAPALAPGDSGKPEAGARIAYVDWCGQGAIGQVDTSGGAGSITTAHWDADPDDVATERHFPAGPDDAYSSVVYDSGRLTATAGVTGVRFTPDCRRGDSASAALPVAEAFDREALLVLESATSTAWWSAASGPDARISVRGLKVLGQPADVSDGDYSSTFTADSGDGTVTVAVSAERGVSRPAESATPPSQDSRPRHAAAWLSVRFEVARIDAEGDPVSAFDYGVRFVGAAVHVPSGGVPATEPPPGSGTASPEPGQAPHADDEPHATADSGGVPDGASPTAAPPGGGGAAPSTDPGSMAGAATGSPSEPPEAPGGDATDAPTQRDPAPGPTVAPPTAPGDESSADPVEGADQDDASGGRLPVAGGALAGLVATGLAALGGGGTAIYLGRGRKTGFDGDAGRGHRASRKGPGGDWS
ncbi:hypothetical protein [Streptomonospora wellingtoniae]|uniref:Htaa domain-containing protein n=1 Tax=Streptomonospora wellingtoniae TaxID=3075544 RepID=A0ABU2KZP6_9ACTN|nr:hypothetical protein [Streptomonospora sp. DSM 45055]MDT0304740.1 hypothetical protein [Streptomonospora sp. DSM 45055]